MTQTEVSAAGGSAAVQFEADDKPPHRLAAALGGQTVALILAGIVLTPVIVLRATGSPESFGSWMIFTAMLVSGLITIVQARRVGRIGAGYVLFMGTSGAFISVSITAIDSGGLALLMTLIIASALLQFPLAANLSLLRKIITPVVGGTAIMLIAVTVMPHVLALLADTAGTPAANPQGGPASAIVTLTVIVLLSVFGNQRMQLWSPLCGLLAGCAAASLYGLVDPRPVLDAAWIGVPALHWPGFDLSFGMSFWQLLPAFLIVTLVGAIETFGDGIAIQRISWRRKRPADFRAVQGAVYADGLGNLLSGLGGTLPNTTYSTSVAVVDMTGVASRRVGIWGGAILLALAFSPKLAALILAVPNPVAGAYLFFLLVLLFMHGVKLAGEYGFNSETILIVGTSFWMGVGFQDQAIFHDYMPDTIAALMSNGMTSGCIIAITLTLLLRLKQGRRRKLKIDLAPAAIPEAHSFLQVLARQIGWDSAAINRLQLAVEEALVVMLNQGDQSSHNKTLLLEAAQNADTIEVSLVTGPQESNLEEQLEKVAQADMQPAAALPFRILQSLVEDMSHHQYHGVDFVTLRVSSRPL